MTSWLRTRTFLIGLTVICAGTLYAAPRYYSVPVIGSGKPGDPYRPKIADKHFWYGSFIPRDSSGVPVFDNCVVLIDTDAAGQFNLVSDTQVAPITESENDYLTSAAKYQQRKGDQVSKSE